jgi:hypothetical protein
MIHRFGAVLVKSDRGTFYREADDALAALPHLGEGNTFRILSELQRKFARGFTSRRAY